MLNYQRVMAWFMHMTSPPDCSKRPVAAREFAKTRATASRQWYIPPEPPNQWIHHIPPLFIGRRDWYKEITAGKLIKSSTLSCLFLFSPNSFWQVIQITRPASVSQTSSRRLVETARHPAAGCTIVTWPLRTGLR